MKTEELKKIVDALKPAFKLNDISEFGKYILFIDNKALVYNGSMSIIVTCETQDNFAVPANEFSKFISKVKSKEIDITNDNTINLKAGNAKAEFAVNNEILERAKELNLIIPTKFVELPKDFINALKLTQYSIGKDKSFENFTYLNVDGNVVASTDNFRVSEYIMESQMEHIMIPGEAVKYLISFNVNSYALNNGFAYFKNEDITFVTRIGDFDFPDYGNYVEDDEDSKIIELPENIVDMVDTASVTADGLVDIDKSINIEIEDRKISVYSSNEVGKISIDNDIDYNESAKIMINPMFLSQILKVTRKITLCSNRVLFILDNFRHVVALLSE